MTVNYFIKCPTCNTITRMRTPAGYIYKTPVRIHCGKCNTLLTGEFVSDNEKEKAYYTPNNCEEVKPQAFDYFGEASGVHSAVLSGRWCGDQRPLCGPAAGECQSVEFGFITTV